MRLWRRYGQAESLWRRLWWNPVLVEKSISVLSIAQANNT